MIISKINWIFPYHFVCNQDLSKFEKFKLNLGLDFLRNKLFALSFSQNSRIVELTDILFYFTFLRIFSSSFMNSKSINHLLFLALYFLLYEF